MSERVDIEIKDKIDPNVNKKILDIVSSSLKAENAISNLKKELLSVSSNSSLSKLKKGIDDLKKSSNAEINTNARLLSSKARLINAESKRIKINSDSALSLKKLDNESKKLAISEQKLKTEKLNTVRVNNSLEQSNIRLQSSKVKLSEQNKKLEIKNQQLVKSKILTAKANEDLKKSIISTTKANEDLKLKSEQLNAAHKKRIVNLQKLKVEQNKVALSSQKVKTEALKTANAQSNLELKTLRLANAQKTLKKNLSASSSQLSRFTRNAAAFAGIGFSSASIVNLTDAYANLENKLLNVSDSAEQQKQLLNQLFIVANNTRSPIDATTKAFQRFDLALKELGGSQQESLRLTETVNKLLVLGGLNVSEQSSALLQLSQAFNKGKLDGDEFRSVMEVIPKVTQAIADELGVTRGALLDLAPAGKITSEVMVKAFKKIEGETDTVFAKLNLTVGQSLTILKNEFIRFASQSTVFKTLTKAIANSILFLSQNLKTLSFIAAIAGTALALAFAPKLIGIIRSIAGSVILLNSAILANPFVALATAITGATVAVVTFGDETKRTEESMATLSDEMKGVIDTVWDLAIGVDEANEEIKKSTSDMAEHKLTTWEKLGIAIVDVTKTTVIGIYAGWKGLGSALSTIYEKMDMAWVDLSNSIRGLTANLLNSLIGYYNDFLNDVAILFNNFINRVNSYNEFFKLPTISTVDLMLSPIEFTKLKSSYVDMGASVGQSFWIGANNAASGLIKSFADNSEAAAKLRADSKGTSKLRGASPKDKPKDLLRRTPANSIRKNLKGSGASNDNSIKSEIKAAEQAKKRSEALQKVNEELDQELKLLGFLEPLQQSMQQLYQIENSLKSQNINLSQQEKDKILEKIQAVQAQSAVQTNLNQIYSETQGAMTNIKEKLDALNLAKQQGIINAETYALKLQKLGLETINLKLSLDEGNLEDVALSSLGRLTENYEGGLSEMSNVFGGFFSTINDGFADSIGRAIVYSDDLGESLKSVAKDALSQLISGMVKMGVQQLINFTLGESLKAASTSTSVAAGAATTAAWAPAAAVTSLASFGANSAGAIAAIGATAASAASSFLTGFETGGYTGNVGTKDVAGIVHGQEFVVNAQGTKNNRNLLEAINSGKKITSANSNSKIAANNNNINVYVENYGSSQISVEKISKNDVRIIAREVASETVKNEAPKVIASDIGNPNSRTSKALSKNTKMERQRA